MNFLKLLLLGEELSKEDQKLKDLVFNTYKSARVVGRGTIKIDPKEVSESIEFKKAREKVKIIFDRK